MIGCVSDHFFYSLAQIKKNAIVIVTHIRNIDKGEINCERAACKKKVSVTSYECARNRPERRAESRIQIQMSWDAQKRKKKKKKKQAT